MDWDSFGEGQEGSEGWFGDRGGMMVGMVGSTRLTELHPGRFVEDEDEGSHRGVGWGMVMDDGRAAAAAAAVGGGGYMIKLMMI